MPSRAEAPPARVPLTPTQNAAWQELLARLSPPAEAQKAVIRALSLAVGSRSQPEVPSGGLLKWLDETSARAKDRTSRFEVMLEQLMVARTVLRTAQDSERRRGLRAALSALHLAQANADPLLQSAIVEGFIAPHLDVADTSGPLGRLTLLSPLLARYALFRIKVLEDQISLPIPSLQAALALARLQLALSSTPDEAAWPRARLAMLLLSVQEEDETPAERAARLREAREVLRGIEAGEGACVFRARIPEITATLGEELQAEDKSEIPTGYALSEWRGTVNSEPARKAHNALLKRLDASAENRRNIIKDAALLAGYKPGVLPAVPPAPRTPGEWDVVGQQHYLWLKNGANPSEIYKRFYPILSQAESTVSNPQSSEALRGTALRVLWETLDASYSTMANRQVGWTSGKVTFFSTPDRLRARICEAWFFPNIYALPVGEKGSAPGAARRYYVLFAGYVYLSKAYPLRPQVLIDREAAYRQQRATGNATTWDYDDNGLVWCAKSRALMDLFSRCAQSRDSWQHCTFYLARALQVEGRHEDAFLALSLADHAWGKDEWPIVEKEIAATLIARVRTTLMRR